MLRIFTGLSLASLVVVAAGCGFDGNVTSIRDSSVSKSQVERIAADQYAAGTSQTAPTVTCPGNLEAKTGASITCKLTSANASQSLDAIVKVTSVDGGNVKFDVTVPGEASVP